MSSRNESGDNEAVTFMVFCRVSGAADVMVSLRLNHLSRVFHDCPEDMRGTYNAKSTVHFLVTRISGELTLIFWRDTG
jgi:hypothetical protein